MRPGLCVLALASKPLRPGHGVVPDALDSVDVTDLRVNSRLQGHTVRLRGLRQRWRAGRPPAW